MNGLTLKHLRYFNALAKNLHFGHASADCAITQPALSIQIKELEAMVGAPLVERTSRQVRLTALGEDFVSRTRSILAAVEELDDLVRSSTEALTGRLRLGVIHTNAPYLLPGIAQALAKAHPEGCSLSTLVQMVGAGIGLTLIPEIAVPFEARAAGVHIARFKNDVPRRKIGLVMRRTTPMAEQLDVLNEIVRELGAQRIADVARLYP